MGESAFPIHGKKQFWKKKYSFSNNDKRINLKNIKFLFEYLQKEAISKKKKRKMESASPIHRKKQFQKRKFSFSNIFTERNSFKNKMETIFLLKKWNEFHINYKTKNVWEYLYTPTKHIIRSRTLFVLSKNLNSHFVFYIMHFFFSFQFYISSTLKHFLSTNWNLIKCEQMKWNQDNETA